MCLFGLSAFLLVFTFLVLCVLVMQYVQCCGSKGLACETTNGYGMGHVLSILALSFGLMMYFLLVNEVVSLNF